MHTTSIQIRFNDADPMGHINNAVIIEYFDLAKDLFFTSRGLPPTDGDFTLIVVHLEADFRQQILRHHPIHVTTDVEKIGNKSLTLLQQVVNSDTGAICAQCRTVLAGYRHSTASSEVIPDEVRGRFALPA